MILSDLYTAQGAITKNRLVKWGTVAQSVAQASAATDRIVGVYIGPSDAADGATVEICMLGKCLLETSGSIGRGMTLTTNASGQGANAAPSPGKDNKAAGIALDSGSSATIPFFVLPHWYTAPPLTATATLNFPSIAAGAVDVLTMTVTGAATGDAVHLGPPAAIEAGLMWSGFVSATNTVSVRLFNGTASAIDPASAAWRATVMRAT